MLIATRNQLIHGYLGIDVARSVVAMAYIWPCAGNKSLGCYHFRSCSRTFHGGWKVFWLETLVRHQRKGVGQLGPIFCA